MGGVEISDVIRRRRAELGMSQAQLAAAAHLDARQIRRYEAGDQQPTLSVAIAIADALNISIAQLAGKVDHALDLSGAWSAAWQTWKDGVPRIDIHPLAIDQRGELLQLAGDRATALEKGSYRWRGELRLWDNEALIGWYRSTDSAVRSKGALYFALHPHGTYAWGRWVGMSYDGEVITGWGAIARTHEQVEQVENNLINSGRP
jgi:transcriptional regulator with XRE-family HTH domain